MVNHPVIMKMHNDNGVLYRTLYEKDPTYGKRRIFIPTTGLNNIERPIEDIIADKVGEAFDEVVDIVKATAEEVVKIRERIEKEVCERLEEDIPQVRKSAMDTIRELTSIAIDRLLNC